MARTLAMTLLKKWKTNLNSFSTDVHLYILVLPLIRRPRALWSAFNIRPGLGERWFRLRYDYPRWIFRILYDRRSKINYFRNRFVFIRIKPVWRIMIIRDTSFGSHIGNNIGIMFTSIYLNYYSVYSDQNFEFFFPIPENIVTLTIFSIKMWFLKN